MINIQNNQYFAVFSVELKVLQERRKVLQKSASLTSTEKFYNYEVHCTCYRQFITKLV